MKILGIFLRKTFFKDIFEEAMRKNRDLTIEFDKLGIINACTWTKQLPPAGVAGTHSKN